MNKLLVSLFLIVICVGSQIGIMAQPSDLIFYTEDGELFTLYVSGQRINEEVAERVTAYEVNADFAQIRIKFDIAGAPEVKSNMMIDPNKEMVSVIKKNKKGKFVLRPVSSNPRMENEEQTVRVPVATASSEHRETSHRRSTDSENMVDLNINENGNVSLKVNMSADATFDTDHDSNLIASGGSRHVANSNISAKVEGKKIFLSDGRTLDWNYAKLKKLTGVEIEMEEPVGARVTVSYGSNVAYQDEVPFYYREPDWKKSSEYFKLTVEEQNGATWSVKLQHSSNWRILINNMTEGGSTHAAPPSKTHRRSNECFKMSDAAFQTAVVSIKNKSFADEKMTVAEQVLRSNCMDVSQVRQVMKLFTYEEEKIAFAKKAYRRTVDQNNFYQVNDELTYTESVDELNSFLESQY